MRDDDELLRLYLLGELETEDEDRLETRLSQDSDLFEQAEAMEADLLDEYEHGGLSPAQRERLESYLAASPSARSQLAMVRALGKVAEEKKLAAVVTGPWWRKELSSPWFRTLAAAMLSIAVLSGGMDLLANRLQNDIERMAMTGKMWVPPPSPTPPPPTPVINHDAEKIVVVKPTPEPVVVQLLQLAVASFRSAEDVKVLRIEPETDRIDLQFSLDRGDETYASYEVAIANTSTGEELIRRDDLQPVQSEKKRVLLLPIQVKQLRPGSYEAAVKGVSAKGESVDLGHPQFEVAEPEMNPQG